jgi:transposase
LHCAIGATNANLADLFDVSTWTIRDWMVRHKEFGDAVRHAKADVFDAKVERALARCA